MGYKEFKLGKQKRKRNVMVAECPIFTVILGTLFDVLLFYYYLGIIIETLIGAISLIIGIIYVARDAKNKTTIRWWSIVLICVGLITLVISWLFPIWLWLIVGNTMIALVVAVIVGVFITIIIITETLRSKKKASTPKQRSITDPGVFKDLEISSPGSVGKER